MRVGTCPPQRISLLPAEIDLNLSHLPDKYAVGFVRKGANCPVKLPIVKSQGNSVTAFLPEKLADCGPGIYEVFIESACERLCETQIEFIAGCRVQSVAVRECTDVKKDCC